MQETQIFHYKNSPNFLHPAKCLKSLRIEVETKKSRSRKTFRDTDQSLEFSSESLIGFFKSTELIPIKFQIDLRIIYFGNRKNIFG